MSTEPTVPGDDETAAAPGREPPPVALTSLEDGDLIGRFRVQRMLGRGGMGLVVAAADDDLGRTVAIKVVRPSGGGSTSPRSKQRLLREARAMARVSHPNVITVHEVGTMGTDVFVAMEFIDGGTLAHWLDERERSWSEIVETWLAAGRGLAAAHAAGLVHRDFKPANVLVSRDGRILVTDFGIAGFVNQREPASDESPEAIGSMTRTGSAMGTPRYMAPEQHEGTDVDARADQFAFCVSLWEAVYGTHPFGSQSVTELVVAVLGGRVQPVPPTATAPTRLRRILERGLSPDREHRYPTMDALLGELRHLLHAGRRRRWALGATVVLGGVLAVGFVSGRKLDPAASVDPCERAAGDWTGVWDNRLRAEVKAAFAETGEPTIALSWQPLEAALDAYVARTDQAHVALCESARLPDADPIVIEVRRRCLRRARVALGALTHLIEGREPTVLGNALDAAAELPDVDICASALVQSAALQVPEAIVEQVDTLDRVIAQAHALGRSGRVDEGLRLLETQADVVESLDHAPSQARFHVAMGRQYASVDVERAEAELRRGYVLATEGADLEVAFSAAYLLGAFSRSPRIAAFWVDMTAATAQRIGLAIPYKLSTTRALRAADRGDLEQAEHWFREALRASESPPDLAGAHGNLGSFLGESQRLEEARKHLHKAVELATEYFGALHPETLKWKLNAVALDILEGDVDRGIEGAQALLETLQSVLPGDHEQLAVTHGLVALGLRAAGRSGEARVHDEESLRIHMLTSGEESPRTLKALLALAGDLSRLGERDEALKLSERMVKVARTIYPSMPELRANYEIARAFHLGRSGHRAEAIAVLGALVGEFSEAGIDGGRWITQAHSELGHWLLEDGRLEAAREHLERAKAMAADTPMPEQAERQLAEDLERLQAPE